MQIEKSPKLGLTTIIPDIKEDPRGTFVEHYNEAELTTQFKALHFVRDCLSTSAQHVLRGIHYDDKTWKLIQCMAGRIYFVVVDMRTGSTDYLEWESFILSEHNRKQVLVPPGYGNGHLVLSQQCTFHYKMTEYYDPDNEKILKWDDPQAKIYWPVKAPILSPKDALGYHNSPSIFSHKVTQRDTKKFRPSKITPNKSFWKSRNLFTKRFLVVEDKIRRWILGYTIASK